jgi:hypothetical protein
MMEQHQRSGGSRNRRKKAKAKAEPKPKQEPVMIVARRPDSPLLMKVSNRNIAASGRPKRARDQGEGRPNEDTEELKSAPVAAEPPRRVVRIAQAPTTAILDDDVLRRERLLERLAQSEGRIAITRVANELLNGTQPLPETQEVHLQLLEHVDEGRARDAMDVLARLFTSQAPIKRPILDQRLRRLETEADEAETRDKAATLRRSLRVA